MVADDKDDVENSFFISQLFSFLFLFIIKQFCIGCGSHMHDNNNKNMQGVWFIQCLYTVMSICSFTQKFLKLGKVINVTD